MNFYVRQVVLDTETTGISKTGLPHDGHRIIEIGAIEMINRRITGKYFHTYLKPNRSIDPDAFKVHGISESFLDDKPNFSDVVDKFLDFIRDSELIIHNAPFDVGFIDHELKILKNSVKEIRSICKIIDTLQLARKLFPGKRNNLNSLCERYSVDNSNRRLHSALLDSKILANVFLLMTSGQITMNFTNDPNQSESEQIRNRDPDNQRGILVGKRRLKIIYADPREIEKHEEQLKLIQIRSGNCLWK